MKRKLFFLFFFFCFVYTYLMPVHQAFGSHVLISEKSAHFENSSVIEMERNNDPRTDHLHAVFSQYHSPLVAYINDILDAADLYGIDWRLLPAISGVESEFCNHIPYGSYNCWGWNNGNHSFEDYHHAIYTVSRALRIFYIDRGHQTLEQIASLYAPPSHSWAKNVYFFMNVIDSQPKNVPTLQITL